jgi:hypothetical protein
MFVLCRLSFSGIRDVNRLIGRAIVIGALGILIPKQQRRGNDQESAAEEDGRQQYPEQQNLLIPQDPS